MNEDSRNTLTDGLLADDVEEMINTSGLHITAYRIEIYSNIIHTSGARHITRSYVERKRAMDESIWDDPPKIDKNGGDKVG